MTQRDSNPPTDIQFTTETPTTRICTLSLHDALPISRRARRRLRPCEYQSRGCAPPRSKPSHRRCQLPRARRQRLRKFQDRKSTRLNSSHVEISYAVFCLKKKKRIYRVEYTCRNDGSL